MYSRESLHCTKNSSLLHLMLSAMGVEKEVIDLTMFVRWMSPYPISPCTHFAYAACWSSWTISWWPPSVAKVRAVLPLILILSFFAPAARRSFTISTWPLREDHIKGVLSLLLDLFTSAFVASNAHQPNQHTSRLSRLSHCIPVSNLQLEPEASQIDASLHHPAQSPEVVLVGVDMR